MHIMRLIVKQPTVEHHYSGNEGFAKASGKGNNCVFKKTVLHYVELIVALWFIHRIYPMFGFEKVWHQFHGRELI